jgi:hypothetical protein
MRQAAQVSQVIEPGDPVAARTATNEWVTFRALTGIERGTDFQVVWVCHESDWERAKNGDHRVRIPWPADEVVSIEKEGTT